jgi:hypothetical protein
MAADTSLALDKLQSERADLENQRVQAQQQLIAVLGALQFCDHLIGVITKEPTEKPAEVPANLPENPNGADPEPAAADAASGD